MDNKINKNSGSNSPNLSAIHYDYYLLFKNIKESKKLLNYFHKFVDEYFLAINVYYKHLTELNCHFLVEGKFKSSITNTLIYKLGKCIKGALESTIKHLFSFINDDGIFNSLNNHITNLNKVIVESSVKLNKKLHEKKIMPVAESLESSYDEIENKIIDEYISEKYNKHLIGLNEEGLDIKLEKAKFLEATIFAFQDGIKEQFITNLNEMENRTLNIFNSLRDTFQEIISRFKKKNTEFIQILEKEINSIWNIGKINNYGNKQIKIEKDLNFNLQDLDIFNHSIKIIKSNRIKVENKKDLNEEKEQKEKIQKAKGKKKENEERYSNKSKSTDKLTYVNNEFLNNNELILTEEDIYNIISKIYSYDLKMINKSQYNLEIEKENLKVTKLTEKLLSFEKDNNKEIISENELKELYKLLNGKERYFKFFLTLNNYRATGKYEMSETTFNRIKNIFNKLQDYLLTNRDTNLQGLLIILSQTFYIMKGNEKIYLQKEIKDHRLYKTKEFWENHLNDLINEEINKIEQDEKEGKIVFSKELKEKKINQIVSTKLITFANYLIEYESTKEMMLSIINPYFDKYNIDEGSKTIILSILNG